MKTIIHRLFATVLAVCLCLGISAYAQASPNTGVTGALQSAEQDAAEAAADEYLESIQGTYIELFEAMDLDENREIWYDNFRDILAVEVEQIAEELRQIIIGMFTTDVCGAEAVALAQEDPTYGSFNCHFISGVSTFKVDGNTISGYDTEGEEIFSHSYTKLADVKYDFGAMNEVYSAYYTDETWPTMAIYESDGEADDFRYFAFCGDSPEESFHIEFRYGAELEGLTSYYNGAYAYWLAAGFLQDAPEGMMEDCINLFVSENAAGFAAYIAE